MGENGKKFVFHACLKFGSFQSLAFARQQPFTFNFSLLALGDVTGNF